MGRRITRSSASVASTAAGSTPRRRWRQATPSSTGSNSSCSTCSTRWLPTSAAAYWATKLFSDWRPRVRLSLTPWRSVPVSWTRHSGGASSRNRRRSAWSIASSTARWPVSIRAASRLARRPSPICSARGDDSACSACCRRAATASTRALSAAGVLSGDIARRVSSQSARRSASSAASCAYGATDACMSARQRAYWRASNFQCRSMLSSRTTGSVRSSP